MKSYLNVSIVCGTAVIITAILKGHPVGESVTWGQLIICGPLFFVLLGGYVGWRFKPLIVKTVNRWVRQ